MEWTYAVKTDTPSRGKGVLVTESLDEAVESVRVLLGNGIAVKAKRLHSDDSVSIEDGGGGR